MKTRAASGERTATSSATGVAVLVVVAIVVASTVLLVATGVVGPPPTSMSTSTATFSATSIGAQSSNNGLELTLTLNSSKISTGQGIAATVEETNTMTTPDNVSAAADWPVGDLAIGPCGSLNTPVGIAVLSGNYDLSNVSSSSALQIYEPGAYACPMILSGISSYVFQASSDNATVFGSCQPSACLNETVSATVSVSGYWNGNSFTSFPSGVYTVVAGDEWGGIAILHFEVTASGA
jgi:hypothetical protein